LSSGLDAGLQQARALDAVWRKEDERWMDRVVNRYRDEYLAELKRGLALAALQSSQFPSQTGTGTGKAIGTPSGSSEVPDISVSPAYSESVADEAGTILASPGRAPRGADKSPGLANAGSGLRAYNTPAGPAEAYVRGFRLNPNNPIQEYTGPMLKAASGKSYLPSGLTGYEPPPGLELHPDPFRLPFDLDDIGEFTSVVAGIARAPGFVLPFLQGLLTPTPPTSHAQAFGTLSSWLLPVLRSDSHPRDARVQQPAQPANRGSAALPRQ
jgi:hypothetical protein